MKHILFAVLLLLSSFAYADRADDIVAGPAEDFCSIARNWYRAGIRNQMYGSKREFKEMNPAMIELLEHKVPLPKDGMYVPEWNGMTDKERSMLSFYVLSGYDASAEHGGFTNEEIDTGTKEYYDSCMEAKTASPSVEK